MANEDKNDKPPMGELEVKDYGSGLRTFSVIPESSQADTEASARQIKKQAEKRKAKRQIKGGKISLSISNK